MVIAFLLNLLLWLPTNPELNVTRLSNPFFIHLSIAMDLFIESKATTAVLRVGIGNLTRILGLLNSLM